MNDVIDICKVEGSVEIDGAEINEKNVDVVTLREKVGMVFQKPNPFQKVFMIILLMAQLYMVLLKIKIKWIT